MIKLYNYIPNNLYNTFTFLIIRYGSVFTALLINIFIARNFSIETLSYFALINKGILVLSAISILGLKDIVMRSIFPLENYNRFRLITNLSYAVFLTSMLVILAIISAYINPFYQIEFFNYIKFQDVLKFGILLLVTSYTIFFEGTLLGLGKPVHSELASKALFQVILSLLILLIFFHDEKSMDLGTLLLIFISSRGIALVTQLLIIKRMLKPQLKMLLTSKFLNLKFYWNNLREGRKIFVTSLGALLIVNSDILMLGALTESDEVAIYSVAVSISMFSILIPNSLAQEKSKIFVDLILNNEKIKLRQLFNKLTVTSSFLVFFQFVIVLVFGKNLLKIWGAEYLISFYPLLILMLAHFISTVFGPNGYVLLISKQDNFLRNNALFMALLNITLNIILIPKIGALGAAIATFFSLTTSNFLKFLKVRKVIFKPLINA